MAVTLKKKASLAGSLTLVMMKGKQEPHKRASGNFGSAIGSLFVFIGWIMVLNLQLTVLWLAFVVFPTALYYQYSTIQGPFSFRHILDGKGVLAQLWFFYGAYHDTVASYPLSLAYLLMILVTFFGSLLVILGSISQTSTRQSAISVQKKYKFCLMVWTSWDHSITLHEASLNLSKNIASAFKDNIFEDKASQDVKKRSRNETVKVYLLRSLAWFITLILIGGGCTIIVYLVVFISSKDQILNKGSNTGLSEFGNVYGTTIIFSLINAVVPVCIKQLPKLEMYASGRDELNITLSRVFFLRMANLFALITSLYHTVTTSSVLGCTGTFLGQEMYKLIIMDTILNLSTTFIMYVWTREKSEFDIPSAVLVLVYRQALIWVGMVACPVLPLVGLLSNIVFFVVNYTIVLKTCKPPIKRWNQSRNTSFYSMFLLASLVLLMPPISVIIGSAELICLGHVDTNNTHCGPFGIEKPTRAYTRFRLSQDSWLQSVLEYLMSEPVLIPFFMIMFCIIMHQRKQMNEDKRQRIVLVAELQQEREANKGLILKLQNLDVGELKHSFHTLAKPSPSKNVK